MPMYEYKCDSCGHSCERYLAGTGAGEEGGTCSECGKGRLKKIFSTFASTCCGSSGQTSPGPAGCGGNGSQFS